jgi:hypothetical protein
VAASLVVWIGLTAVALGSLGVVRPIRAIGLAPRRRSRFLLMAGIVAAFVGCMLPAPTMIVPGVDTRLDAIVPAYQFDESHAIDVAASPERVYRAMRDVTAGEIPLFHTLTWIRRFGRRTPESILNAPDSVPIIDVATRTGFMVLDDDPPREIVFGTMVLAPDTWRRADAPNAEALRNISAPGFAKAIMNFRIVAKGPNASTLTTETRVFGTDARSVKRFALYWRVIYPGSALIRRMWLRAIRARAERAN